MLLWVQYHVNTTGRALAVVEGLGILLWVQYHVNTNGGAVAIGAVWVCYFGCTTMLILVVAL